MAVHQSSKFFNIVSLDGGGIRGVVEACLLEQISSRFTHFLRDVDLLVGTSTGGIIALGLAAGHSPSFLREMYEKVPQNIFVGQDKNLKSATYKTDVLRAILEQQFGDLRLGDLEKTIAITAFYLDDEAEEGSRTWKAKIFHNCKGSDADLDVRVVDLALRTSAVPTYFPIIDGYIDGGVFATNPSMVALAQALDSRGLNKELKNISLLSLGSGSFRKYIEGKALGWGLSDWAPHLLDLLMNGSVEVVDFQCKQILREKYYRLNPKFSQHYPLDDWQSTPALLEAAKNENIDSVVFWLEKNWK